MPVWCDDQARQVSLPIVLDSAGHGGRGLTGTDHNGIALRPDRQSARNQIAWPGSLDSAIEQGS